MDYLVVGFIALAAVVGVVVTMTLRIGSSANSQVTNRIVNALRRVRLFRMLQARGVDVDAYAQSVDARAIREQVSACETCVSVERCDTVLGSGDSVDVSFCPNAENIDRAATLHPVARPGANAEPSREEAR